MRGGVRDEKMPVSAPDFPCNFSRCAEILREFNAKRAAPANDFFEECGSKLHGDTSVSAAPTRNQEEQFKSGDKAGPTNALCLKCE